MVPNLKWRFSDSKTRILNGGWVREQVIQDLPQSHDIAAAQQHLRKGAIRELHWHTVVCSSHHLPVRNDVLTMRGEQAEWGIVYSGSVLVSAVDENGRYQAEKLNYGDIWVFTLDPLYLYVGSQDDISTFRRDCHTQFRGSTMRTSTCLRLTRPTLTRSGAYSLIAKDDSADIAKAQHSTSSTGLLTPLETY